VCRTAVDSFNTSFVLNSIVYNSSAVAEMGDRGHNRHGPKRGGGLLCPFRGALAPRLIQCGLGRGLLPYQVASSSSRLATIDMGQKLSDGGCAFCILVLPPVWPQRTLAENWGAAVPLYGRRAWFPSKTISRRPRPTSVPSGILIHAAVWPQ